MVEINGNICTITDLKGIANVIDVICAQDLKQFSVDNNGKDRYSVSFPMTTEHHNTFAAEIAVYNHRQKHKKKVDTKSGKPDNDGPKGPTPPSGGTPGAQRQVSFENTVAIAA